MARRGRPGLSRSQKKDLWVRWKRGESLSDIARALGKKPGSIHGVVSSNGGMVPATRRRSPWALKLSEREEISRGLAAGDSLRRIASRIKRAPSTVSREVARHGGRERYRAAEADETAWGRARRPKSFRLSELHGLKKAVAEKLSLNWSPEQISGWLEQRYAEVPEMQISHETIYRSLYMQGRGILEKRLLRHLRSRRTMRRSKRASTRGQPRGQIVDAVSIHDRPEKIEDRMVAGHWEGDLIAGSRNSHIATLVERKSRFTILVRVEGKDSKTVIEALIGQIRLQPEKIWKTVTWDRGMELAGHREFSMKTMIPVYFCDPRSPWQRGTNENTNRLLRQYFPKSTDLSEFSQKHLDRVALQLNQRPRKVLSFNSPETVLNEAVALTG